MMRSINEIDICGHLLLLAFEGDATVRVVLVSSIDAPVCTLGVDT